MPKFTDILISIPLGVNRLISSYFKYFVFTVLRFVFIYHVKQLILMFLIWWFMSFIKSGNFFSILSLTIVLPKCLLLSLYKFLLERSWTLNYIFHILTPLQYFHLCSVSWKFISDLTFSSPILSSVVSSLFSIYWIVNSLHFSCGNLVDRIPLSGNVAIYIEKLNIFHLFKLWK